MAKYRRQRMAELKAAQTAARFGELRQVGRTDFVAQVTEASANGQWVLTLLFTNASPQCHPLMEPWAEAARRFPAIKFLKGVASEVVPDFPDSSTPTVLVYKDTDCKHQIGGLAEWGGGRCNVDCVEWVLAKYGVVETDLEEDPRNPTSSPAKVLPRATDGRRGWDEDEEDDEGNDTGRDDRCYTSARLGKMFQGRPGS
ncbi:unnamed protein product [Polarella glacialis]|uniref:Phosducin thioredoxin-like domain-containing protein n=1 Tax=Polarella glacialis TaxID=89957 RepID=A0A813IHA6_POLGL|nr:unnamed protein product [Polarella glacialis]CAE8691865.1 unnamed protein product [Polarella glacialis]